MRLNKKQIVFINIITNEADIIYIIKSKIISNL